MTPLRFGLSRRTRTSGNSPRTAFWILSGLLALAFLTGGSSRGNAPLLFILRPVAILAAAYGLSALPRERWHTYRYPLLLAAGVVLLTIAHLVPLPPALWHLLPQHVLIGTIDAAAGVNDHWRPLSLAPSRTLNALFALSVPMAALILAVLLGAADRIRILYVILALAAISAVVGLLQAAGAPINIYLTDRIVGTVQAPGLFANQNHQAALLAAMLPMLAVAVRWGSHHLPLKWLKPVAASCGVLIVVLIIATGSRAGLVLGAVSIALTLFYGLMQIDRLDRMTKQRASYVKLAVGAAIIAVATLTTVITARDVAFSRLQSAASDLRPRVWASIVPILPDYQPFGSGIGSYVETYRSREPDTLLRPTHSNHAHNEYLEISLTAGVPGVLLLTGAALLCAQAFRRNRKGSEPDEILARLGLTIIAIMACASITDYPLRTPLLASIFAIAVMWCGGAHPIGRRERRKSDDTSTPPIETSTSELSS